VPYGEVEGRLGAAIRAIRDGRLWVRAEILEEFAEQASKLSKTQRRGGRLFTTAEERALGFLRLRLSNKEIASKMEIGERTVKFHLQNIFTELGVHDRYSVIEMLKAGKLSGLGDAWRKAKDGQG
jgi:DNA-binding NarL/FixJ family response regulator